MKRILQYLQACLFVSLIVAVWTVVFHMIKFMDDVREDAIVRVSQHKARIDELKEAVNRQGWGLKDHKNDLLDHAHKKWGK